jgi:hypothetical protein
MEKKKYRLGILDEYQGDIDDFLHFFEDDFDVEVLELFQDQDMVIKNILEAKLDALAIDFKLMEYNTTIGFNGDAIYNEITNKLYDFPAFILTNYVPEASNSSIEDDFRIISKRWLDTKSKEAPELIQKIIFSIDKYKKRINEAENELLVLLDKKKNHNLSGKEEERLIELDSILEKTIDKEYRIPRQWKKEKSEISKLIDLAENILKKEEN